MAQVMHIYSPPTKLQRVSCPTRREPLNPKPFTQGFRVVSHKLHTLTLEQMQRSHPEIQSNLLGSSYHTVEPLVYCLLHCGQLGTMPPRRYLDPLGKPLSKVETMGPIPLNPKPLTLDPSPLNPLTLNPKPLNPEPLTLNP